MNSEISNLTDKWFQDEQKVWWKNIRIDAYGYQLKLRGEVRVCQQCNKNYLVLSGTKYATQRFCSIDCSVIGKRKFKVEAAKEISTDVVLKSSLDNPININDTWKREGNTWWKHYKSGIRTKGMIKNCANCSEYFLKIPCQHHTIFCSLQCAGNYTTKTRPPKTILSFDEFKEMYLNGKYDSSDRSNRGSHMWKGGRSKISRGYIEIYCPYHPYSRGGKYVREHRLVMELHLGRFLFPKETIHHKNGNREDNRLENLELWNGNHPYGQRREDLFMEEIKKLSNEEFQEMVEAESARRSIVLAQT